MQTFQTADKNGSSSFTTNKPDDHLHNGALFESMILSIRKGIARQENFPKPKITIGAFLEKLSLGKDWYYSFVKKAIINDEEVRALETIEMKIFANHPAFREFKRLIEESRKPTPPQDWKALIRLLERQCAEKDKEILRLRKEVGEANSFRQDMILKMSELTRSVEAMERKAS